MRFNLAVDAMGGDNAPQAVVKGIELFLEREKESRVLLVGPKDTIEPLYSKKSPENIVIVDCAKYIPMDSKLNLGLFRDNDTTIHKIIGKVKNGEADVAYSAGNTAIFVSMAVTNLGMIEGIERPAIAVHLPNLKGTATLFLDAGANVTPKVGHLVQNAKMGSLYAKEVLGIKEPKVGLLNIGEEETKGDELRQKTYKNLSGDKAVNFIGNIEGYELFLGKADVVVTDGFSGNLVLKVSEGITKTFKNMLLREAGSSYAGKIGMLLAKKGLKNFSRRADYAEYGGGILLGVNGIVIISHGRSSPRAIMNGLTLGRMIASRSFVNILKESEWLQKSLE